MTDKTRGQIAIEALDEVAAHYEAKWGCSRLPRLVPVDLAERFFRQKAKLDAAITVGSIADQEHEAGRMVNAWRALDAEATVRGALTKAALGPGVALEARLSDGRLLVVTDDPERLAPRYKGVEALVWSMAEIASVIENDYDLVNVVKTRIEGARLEAVRVPPPQSPEFWQCGDEIPF